MFIIQSQLGRTWSEPPDKLILAEEESVVVSIKVSWWSRLHGRKKAFGMDITLLLPSPSYFWSIKWKTFDETLPRIASISCGFLVTRLYWANKPFHFKCLEYHRIFSMIATMSWEILSGEVLTRLHGWNKAFGMDIAALLPSPSSQNCYLWWWSRTVE